MDGREEQLQKKREERRKRRVRNQIMAYTVLGIIVLALAAGIVFGVRYLLKMGTDTEQKEQEEQQEKQDMINEILSSEDDIAAVSPEPVPEPAEPTEEEMLDELVDARIESMSLEDKVAGLFLVTPETVMGGTAVVQAGEDARQALTRRPVGGLVWLSQNIQSEEQIREMFASIKEYATYPLFMAVDEEGGSVARVTSAGIGSPAEAASEIGASGDPRNAYQAGVSIGNTLSALGFNLDFAPVADLANVEGSIMAGRSYGTDPAVVSEFVISVMTGLEEQKVTACLKHFPGIGSSTEDTHEGMAATDRTAEQFWAEELAVFGAGIEAGANMIMVGHMAAPALTGDNNPCIFSRTLLTDILRERMGFSGVIITDALNMSAVSEYYGADEAAIMAVLAGCDMLLMPEDFEKAYTGVLQAVQEGNISEDRIDDSLRRIYRIKYADMVGE